jgi:hypothetical protein
MLAALDFIHPLADQPSINGGVETLWKTSSPER